MPSVTRSAAGKRAAEQLTNGALGARHEQANEVSMATVFAGNGTHGRSLLLIFRFAGPPEKTMRMAIVASRSWAAALKAVGGGSVNQLAGLRTAKFEESAVVAAAHGREAQQRAFERAQAARQAARDAADAATIEADEHMAEAAVAMAAAELEVQKAEEEAEGHRKAGRDIRKFKPGQRTGPLNSKGYPMGSRPSKAESAACKAHDMTRQASVPPAPLSTHPPTHPPTTSTTRFGLPAATQHARRLAHEHITATQAQGEVKAASKARAAAAIGADLACPFCHAALVAEGWYGDKKLTAHETFQLLHESKHWDATDDESTSYCEIGGDTDFESTECECDFHKHIGISPIETNVQHLQSL